jgi:hypothetical protein
VVSLTPTEVVGQSDAATFGDHHVGVLQQGSSKAVAMVSYMNLSKPEGWRFEEMARLGGRRCR